METKECCETCQCWKDDRWMNGDGNLVNDSVCKLNPTPISKQPTDWCGQHKPLIASEEDEP